MDTWRPECGQAGTPAAKVLPGDLPEASLLERLRRPPCRSGVREPPPDPTSRLATQFQPNLGQVFATKHVTPGWAVSGDYMAGAGTHTMRLGVSGDNRFGLDILRVEMYREMARPRGFGLGVHARRSVTPRILLEGGYGDIDARQALLSGTEFFDGRRVYARADVRVTRALTGRVLWTRAFANSRPIAAARRIEAGLRWDGLAPRR